MDFLLQFLPRLKEKSTVVGIVTTVGGIVGLNQGLVDPVSSLVAAVAGLLLVIFQPKVSA